MVLRQFLFAETSCASYLFGCTTHNRLGVVDPHASLVESYLAEAEQIGAPIVAVFETHIQADHVSGLPALVEEGATPYLPAGVEVDFEFDHEELGDGDQVELGNTLVRAFATPGHASAHNAYVVADRRRGTDDPWFVFTGDSLLVGDVGRPDLHGGNPLLLGRLLHRSLQLLLALPDDVLVLPSHYAGSVCGRSLSGNPISSIGFERKHNEAVAEQDPEVFARAIIQDLPPAPAEQRRIVAANRRGDIPARR